MRYAALLLVIMLSSAAVAQDKAAQDGTAEDEVAQAETAQDEIAPDEAALLAQKLANPIAALYSFPLQFNFDENMGTERKGERTTTIFQPIIPIGLKNGADIITRSIFSYINQDDVIPGTSQSGFGDIQLTAVYSDTTPKGASWGLGGILKVPTGSEVSGDTWALGPAAVGLRVDGPWTYGALTWHQWDIERNPETRTNNTFIQPFAAYSTKNAWTFTAMTESNYDWTGGGWSIPLNFQISKLVPFRKLPINVTGGVGYWAASPTGGAEGWRARIQLQAVIPRR